MASKEQRLVPKPWIFVIMVARQRPSLLDVFSHEATGWFFIVFPDDSFVQSWVEKALRAYQMAMKSERKTWMVKEAPTQHMITYKLLLTSNAVKQTIQLYPLLGNNLPGPCVGE
jgi:hypothetical protein